MYVKIVVFGRVALRQERTACLNHCLESVHRYSGKANLSCLYWGNIKVRSSLPRFARPNILFIYLSTRNKLSEILSKWPVPYIHIPSANNLSQTMLIILSCFNQVFLAVLFVRNAMALVVHLNSVRKETLWGYKGQCLSRCFPLKFIYKCKTMSGRCGICNIRET